MKRITSWRLGMVAAAIPLVLGLASCGSNTNGGGTGTSADAAGTASSGADAGGTAGSGAGAETNSSAGVDAASSSLGRGSRQTASAEVTPPAAILAAGVLRIAVSTSPPYSEKNDSGQWVGITPALLTAIGDQLGVKTEFIDSKFETIMPGLVASRFDAAAAIGDFIERRKSATFVDMAQSHLTVLVQAGGDFQPKTLLDLCNHQIAYEAATAGGQAASRLLGQKCKTAGKSFTDWKGFPDQAAIQLAVRSGRVEGGAAPISANSLAAANSDGKLLNIDVDGLVNVPGANAIYGIAVAKDSKLADAILKALTNLVASGQYTTIFEKFDLPGGALPPDQIKINGSPYHQG